MALEPDYGETVVSDEDAEALTSLARESLGDPIRKSDLYDLEQTVQDEVADEWWETLLNWDIPVQELLTDHFVRELHQRLYAPIWRWGGRQRTLETNIGVAAEQIAVELRPPWIISDINGTTRRESMLTLGIAAHAAVVEIHPFKDGNGRVTRLLADLVFLAAQTGWEPLLGYDWEIDRRTYIQLLKEYDTSGDPTRLAEFIPVLSLEGD